MRKELSIQVDAAGVAVVDSCKAGKMIDLFNHVPEVSLKKCLPDVSAPGKRKGVNNG